MSPSAFSSIIETVGNTKALFPEKETETVGNVLLDFICRKASSFP